MQRSNRGRGPAYFILLAAGLVLAAAVAAVAIWNLDVVLRLFHRFQDGTLNGQAVRLELDAFDIGAPGMPAVIEAKRSPIDNMNQVLVPQGEFMMGDSSHPGLNDYPQHKVYLDAFWIDQIPVTNSMYALCYRAGVCSEPALKYNTYFANWVYRDYPVIFVNWTQAQAYCQWAGRRLPTEAEYEKAARGTDSRRYPWGDQSPTPRLANFGGLLGETQSAYRYVLGASPYGALNMVGNIREWVWDWFDPQYYAVSPYANPRGPDAGTQRSLRGGSLNESALEIRAFWRFAHEPQSAGLSRGFRCAESTSSSN